MSEFVLPSRTAVCVACCLVCSAPALAQSVPPQPATVGEWLLNASSSDALVEPPVAHWLVPQQRRPQAQLKQQALDAAATAYSNDWLAWWLSLPVTGRTPLASSNPLALIGSLRDDPPLELDQTLKTYPNVQQVAVVLPDGQVCAVPWVDKAYAQSYVQACFSLPSHISHVGLAQPDMTTHVVGVQPYSEHSQPHPQPGSWVVVPAGADHPTLYTLPAQLQWLATLPPFEYLVEHHPAPAPIAVAREVDVTIPQRPMSDLAISASDWGETGLLQTPTARMAEAGNARFTLSHVSPYTRGTIMLQPFDWLEAGFRYTNIANRLYGPKDFSGDQDFKDKSIDLKLKLLPESGAWQPQVALGIRDIGGTGLFSSEYLVASKRWGNLDTSLGLAWGNMGSRANLRNPLSGLLGSDWNHRPTGVGGDVGGEIGTKAFFKGSVALFGGVQYQASPQWLLKAEIDGNNYQSEPLNNPQKTSSPINFGVTWRYSPYVDVGVGWERGQRLGLSLTLHTGPQPFGRMYMPKTLDTPLPRLTIDPPVQASATDTLRRTLEGVSAWTVLDIQENQPLIRVTLQTEFAAYTQERIDRMVAVLHAHLPAAFQKIEFRLQDRGLNLVTVDVDRAEWLRGRVYPVPEETRLPAQTIRPSDSSLSEEASSISAQPHRLEWSPYYAQSLGGPDGFILFQTGVRAYAEYSWSQQTWLAGQLNLRLLDNYDQFKFGGFSELPRVRTHVKDYVTTSRVNLPLAQLTTVADLGDGHYSSVYGGLLESMFAGVGAEWYYRPWNSSWSVGTDINHVQQRDFAQDFGLRDYRTTTGHATLYWDTGWSGLQTQISAGRYLAGDAGITIDLSRRFDNGVSVGAWATKTNISAQQFGEGSFDKGIYVRIPFDLMFPRSTGGMANLIWSPLTRDGGARLSRRFPLHDIVRLRDPSAWRLQPALDSRLRSGEMPATTGAMHSSHWVSPKDTASDLWRSAQETPVSAWLGMAGAVGLSAALDRPARRWADQHTDGHWSRAATVSNAIPAVLGVTNLALATGVVGEASSLVAQRALHAGVYALAGSMALKTLAQRDRPNGRSGAFSSNHMAVAMALVTPWAEYNDSPWLYGLAAATAYGRVQSREHWVSDTVTGGLLGYVIGRWVGAPSTAPRTDRQLFVQDRHVGVQWHY
ncbi:YjbH domain-containing protein [Macromonas bipunctata]|uniref:YjbH domain-containing protein n=1 Tax=Macromonas bipunctata TaxID=183670 RepID=UPI000C31D966|nr:YjbH domain-containing protein [Macromonas bipunctata]